MTRFQRWLDDLLDGLSDGEVDYRFGDTSRWD
jgi:hypothetical protein